PALGLGDAPLDDLLVLLVRQRRAFARGADRNQAVGALGDLPVHQLAERFFVDPGVPERRDERGEGSPEPRLGGHGVPRFYWTGTARRPSLRQHSKKIAAASGR